VSINYAIRETVLSRVEDAGLNASAPPQQRWVDGWLVRFSPGKAKRARCINAVAPGRLDLQDKLAACGQVFIEAGLPLVVRVTPFSQPATLDRELDALGFSALDDTRVMVCADLPGSCETNWPEGVGLLRLGHSAFAHTVGQLRGSPLAQQQAHAQRLELSPVPFEGWALRRTADGVVFACGQVAREGDVVGLYDVFTAPESRGQGWSRRLCRELLARAANNGARLAYLQVDAGNDAARAVYRQLGFVDGYAYHYRAPPGTLP
jgi:ribosomal protein S18 acetylase RimI-like enzyme